MRPSCLAWQSAALVSSGVLISGESVERSHRYGWSSSWWRVRLVEKYEVIVESLLLAAPPLCRYAERSGFEARGKPYFHGNFWKPCSHWNTLFPKEFLEIRIWGKPIAAVADEGGRGTCAASGQTRPYLPVLPPSTCGRRGGDDEPAGRGNAHRPIRPMNVINGDVNRLVNAVKVPVCRACFFSSRAGHATHPLRPTRPRSVRVAAARGDFESLPWSRPMLEAMHAESGPIDRRRPETAGPPIRPLHAWDARPVPCCTSRLYRAYLCNFTEGYTRAPGGDVVV